MIYSILLFFPFPQSRRHHKATVPPAPRFDRVAPVDSAHADSIHPLTRSVVAYYNKSRAKTGGGSHDDLTNATADQDVTTPTSVGEDLTSSKSGVSLRRSNRLSTSTNKRLSDHALHVSAMATSVAFRSWWGSSIKYRLPLFLGIQL